MPPSPASYALPTPPLAPSRLVDDAAPIPRPGSDFPVARTWFLYAIGSLVLAGLLSLLLVLGRLPFLAPLFTDPLFFKRALVVHVDLALVVWFQAGTAAFLGLALGRALPHAAVASSLVFGGGGLCAMLAGAAIPGAQPILANYVPVIDHPLFLAGLASWFAGTGIFFAAALAAGIHVSHGAQGQRAGWGRATPDADSEPNAAGAPHPQQIALLPAHAGNRELLPDGTIVALKASAAANLLAIATFAAAWQTTLRGLPAVGFYELVAWGGGHVLQVANVSAMIGWWLLLLERWSGRPVLSSPAVRWLLAALVLPQFPMPFLAIAGTSHPAYTEMATALMRWTIFPAVLVALGLGVRHVLAHRRHAPTDVARVSQPVTGHTGPETRATPDARGWLDFRTVGFAGSAALTVLGFVLGALIRGSNTLVPGHYHAAIGAVTISLMAAAYEFCPAVAPRARPAPPIPRARLQLLLFGGGQAVFALGFAIAGAYGLGRKQYAAEQHVRTFGESLGLGVMGTGGLVAVAGGILFLVLMLRNVAAWRVRSAASPTVSSHE